MNVEPFDIDADLVRRESYSPWWSWWVERLESLLRLMPTHRANKKGRKAARQLRGVCLATGVAIMIFGGSVGLVLAGAAVMGGALVLPLSVVTKRAWLGRLRRLRTGQVRDARSPGEIRCDGKRLVLRERDHKLRRVLIDRDDHQVRRGRIAGHPCLGVIPPSARKAESIWIYTRAAQIDRPDGPVIDRDAVDIWARISPNDWATLESTLGPTD